MRLKRNTGTKWTEDYVEQWALKYLVSLIIIRLLQKKIYILLVGVRRADSYPAW